MADYRISYIGDNNVSNVHHIGVDFNGNYYSVIFGKYVNGGFFSIPNWNVGGELGEFSDTFWNEESLSRALRSKKAAKVIAMAIAEFAEEQKGCAEYVLQRRGTEKEYRKEIRKNYRENLMKIIHLDLFRSISLTLRAKQVLSTITLPLRIYQYG